MEIPLIYCTWKNWVFNEFEKFRIFVHAIDKELIDSNYNVFLFYLRPKKMKKLKKINNIKNHEMR